MTFKGAIAAPTESVRERSKSHNLGGQPSEGEDRSKLFLLTEANWEISKGKFWESRERGGGISLVKEAKRIAPEKKGSIQRPQAARTDVP